MTQSRISGILLTAAIYNWSAAAMLFFHEPILSVLDVGPVPNHPIWISIAAALIGSFGFGYYWASRDVVRNMPILKLGVVGKIAVFVAILAATVVQRDVLSIGMLASALVDVVYAVFFVYVIRTTSE